MGGPPSIMIVAEARAESHNPDPPDSRGIVLPASEPLDWRRQE